MKFQSYEIVRQAFIDHWNETQRADTQTTAYDITIKQPPVDEGQKFWACIGAYHLTPAENQGKHNLFLEAMDENNNRIFGAVFKWGWRGQGPDEPSPDLVDDKPPDELANLVVWANQIIWAGVRDTLPSGEVHNVRTTHPDEDSVNTWGHHSFYAAFKRVRAGDDNGNGPGPEPPPDCGEMVELAGTALKRIEKAEAELSAAKKALNKILEQGEDT